MYRKYSIIQEQKLTMFEVMIRKFFEKKLRMRKIQNKNLEKLVCAKI